MFVSASKIAYGFFQHFERSRLKAVSKIESLQFELNALMPNWKTAAQIERFLSLLRCDSFVGKPNKSFRYVF